jgi:hydroxyquinol 1,2-dioxygenase
VARDLTDEVLRSFAGAPDPRVREIAESLVRHLHGFVAEVEPTEEEWRAAIGFLTRTGHTTTDTRQEWILLSDVLGVSMQVIGINHPKPTGATESTVFGPFFVEGSPRAEAGDDISGGAKGQPCHVAARVLDVAGAPVAGARVEVWQADEDGFYDVQYEDLDRPQGRAHLFSGEDGRLDFWTVLPEAYPIPQDGPVGELLRAAERSPMRPAHVHFMVSAAGYETLTTHVFAAGDPYLGSDAVFGVKESLVAEFARHEPGEGPGGRTLEVPWFSMAYDLVLAPAP